MFVTGTSLFVGFDAFEPNISEVIPNKARAAIFICVQMGSGG